ncbi:hypothetical protein HDV57DRAFT_492730 [Trichoderma longibrachiatum]|uniref:Uncharacterized protein n=1 Tax=Trichoderma longibrachiatum ATCC 18648 TaxID=983965 RepID=A0A2T4BPY8_TRILO|nr:hypothetical protein M440DRAFT_217588 [Trichoderma longibrachiatum ATCC 18648]
MLPYLVGYSYCTRTQICLVLYLYRKWLCCDTVLRMYRLYNTNSMSARSTKHSVQLHNLNKNRNTSRSSSGDGFGTSGLSWENSAEQWISVSAIDKSQCRKRSRVSSQFTSRSPSNPGTIYSRNFDLIFAIHRPSSPSSMHLFFSHTPCHGPPITSDYPPANPQSRKGKTEDTNTQKPATCPEATARLNQSKCLVSFHRGSLGFHSPSEWQSVNLLIYCSVSVSIPISLPIDPYPIHPSR